MWNGERSTLSDFVVNFIAKRTTTNNKLVISGIWLLWRYQFILILFSQIVFLRGWSSKDCYGLYAIPHQCTPLTQIALMQFFEKTKRICLLTLYFLQKRMRAYQSMRGRVHFHDFAISKSLKNDDQQWWRRCWCIQLKTGVIGRFIRNFESEN